MAKILSFSKTKLLFTEHDTYNRRRSNFILKYIDRFIYKQYEEIITISQGADLNLRNHLKSDLNTTIIYNGVDLLRVKREAKLKEVDLQSKYKNFKIILQIAQFRKQKDQLTVIRALSRLPDNYVLFFAGTGEEQNKCKKLVLNLGMEERVLFLGLRENIGSIINLCDIYVMSSNWEGFGRSAVEAMALGKPVIASEVEGLKEVVSEAGLFFPVGDDKKLAEIILELIGNLNMYEEVSENCSSKSKLYSIDRMVNSYENIYKKYDKKCVV
jgi:glycosyltransferase involved in cell wall biosynthesis